MEFTFAYFIAVFHLLVIMGKNLAAVGIKLQISGVVGDHTITIHLANNIVIGGFQPTIFKINLGSSRVKFRDIRIDAQHPVEIMLSLAQSNSGYQKV